MDFRRTERARAKNGDGRAGRRAPLRRLGATWAWLALLPLLAPVSTPVDLGASASLRSSDPAAPPGPGDRTPTSGALDPLPIVPGGTTDACPTRTSSRRPLPGPIGEERPGHRSRVDRPPRLAV